MGEWVFWMNCPIALIWGIHCRSQLQQPLFQRGFTNTNNVLFRLMRTSAWQRWACWSDRCLHLLSILSRAQSWPYVAVTPWSHPSSLAAAALSETQRRPAVHVCLRVGSSQKQSLKKKVKFFVNLSSVFLSVQSNLQEIPFSTKTTADINDSIFKLLLRIFFVSEVKEIPLNW